MRSPIRNAGLTWAFVTTMLVVLVCGSGMPTSPAPGLVAPAAAPSVAADSSSSAVQPPAVPKPAPGAATTASPCAFHYPSDARVPYQCRVLERGQTLESVFGDAWTDVARFNRIDRRHAKPGVRLRVPDSLGAISCFTPMPARLAADSAQAKSLLVDLSEQFVGAYEHGRLVFSAPVASGGRSTPTPTGEFRITRAHRDHRSSLYRIAGTQRPYPMDWGLRFHVGPDGVSYWIHGRDLPGVPASHGCIGLSDEAMQKRCYGVPAEPVLADAQALYRWVLGAGADSTHDVVLAPGVPLRIVGECPLPGVRPAGDAGGAGLSGEHGRGVSLAVTAVQSGRLR